jgi:hypothetical protein
MRQFVTFGIGMLCRALSILAGQYAEWLMQKIADGSPRVDIRTDLKRFWSRLLSTLAQQFSGLRGGQYQRYEDDDFQPGLYPAR